MKVIDQGHIYLLRNLDVRPGWHEYTQPLVFVKRDNPPEKYPGNIGHYPGTNMQEVLRALIDRIKYVGNQVYDASNTLVLRNLREALFLLEVRAAGRHGRHLALSYAQREQIEDMPTCHKCGYIFPESHRECR